MSDQLTTPATKLKELVSDLPARLSHQARQGMHAVHHKTGADARTIRRFGRPAAASSGSEKAEQLQLLMAYRRMFAEGARIEDMQDVEARWYSENGEDGILLYLLAAAGMPTRRCVEIGAGDGLTNNTANLILTHGYEALLFEGDPQRADFARDLYGRHLSTKTWPPIVRSDWITSANINDLVAGEGFTGEIDLLSLDIDSTDYWIWEAIDVISPRVVVLEYNNVWGPGEAYTLPNLVPFQMVFEPDNPLAFYGGASLEAMNTLSNKKGYRLVGSEHLNWNAFFVRNDVAEDLLPEVSVESCLNHPYAVHAQKTRVAVKSQPWVTIS